MLPAPRLSLTRTLRLAATLVVGLVGLTGTPPSAQAQGILGQARNEPAPTTQAPATGPVTRQTDAPANVYGGPGGVMRNTGRRVNDFAGILTTQEQSDLERKLYALEDSTGTQIVILAIPTLGGQMDPAMYATKIGEEWRAGQAGQDNGAVILVVKDDRQMFIATGKGLEGSVPDAIASRIVRNVLAPAFREGRFYDGLSEAIDVIALATKGEFVAPDDNASGSSNAGGAIFCLILIVIFVVVLIIASRGNKGGGGRRYRSSYGGPPVVIWGGGGGSGGGGWSSGGGGGGGGIDFGGFSGGGGSFGGGGAGGSW